MEIRSIDCCAWQGVLKTIHQAFYGQVERGFTPDVRVIMPALKQEVLSDCYLVLSGIIPTDLDPHQNETWTRVCPPLAVNLLCARARDAATSDFCVTSLVLILVAQCAGRVVWGGVRAGAVG